jgi:glycosyltransferase involved in cell wall biosynthesis
MGVRGRLLIVSHPSVVTVNQAVYVNLKELGWEPHLVVPDHWTHEYGSITPSPLPELSEGFVRLRIAGAGKPQRHFYLSRLRPLIDKVGPAVAFLEQEPFSAPARQWGSALARAGVPFGVQMDENLDRPYPLPARRFRSWVLPRASFVAARSPSAAELARRWGALGSVAVVPHAVPGWSPRPGGAGRPFTVGYAGRLIAEKGVFDLIEAVRLMPPPVRLLFAGDGPLRGEVEQASLPNGEIVVRTDYTHDTMPDAYAEMDVLVLPSRSTPTWEEQFGRVIVESLSCCVPVVGSDSGEIPWVIESTGGGRVFPEGDATALGRELGELRDSPEERARLARVGRENAQRLFGLEAAAMALDELLVSAT